MLECWSHFKKRLAGLLHPDWCWTELHTYYHTAVALMLEVNSCGGQNGRHSSHFALIVMMKIVSGLYATTASQRLTHSSCCQLARGMRFHSTF